MLIKMSLWVTKKGHFFIFVQLFLLTFKLEFGKFFKMQHKTKTADYSPLLFVLELGHYQKFSRSGCHF